MSSSWTLGGHGTAGDTLLPVGVNLGDTTGHNFIVVGVLSGEHTHECAPYDNKGNSFVPGGYAPYLGASGTIRLWWCFNPTVGTGHIVSIDNDTHLYAGMIAQSWAISGNPSDISVDQQNGAYAYGAGSVQPGSITPTTDDQMVFLLGADSPLPLSVSSPYTLNAEQNSYAQLALAWNLQTTASATNPTVTPSSGTHYLELAVIASFKVTASGPPPPSITSVNGGADIESDATGVAFIGTDMGADETERTVSLVQGAVEVEQTQDTGDDTSGSFDVSGFEVPGGTLTYGVSTDFKVETADGSDTLAVTVVPPAGYDYVTLASVHSPSSERITATGDLSIGDVLIYDTVGGKVTINDDATFDVVDETVTSFDVACFNGTEWGNWGTQTISMAAQSFALARRRRRR